MPQSIRTACVVCFWAYGMSLLFATHAPADEVKFLVLAVDYGLLDPDKLLHLAAYFLLGLLAGIAYGPRWHAVPKAAAVLFVSLAAWGFVDELTQPLFGRTCDVNDWISDMVGAAIGLAFGLAAERWLTARLRSAG